MGEQFFGVFILLTPVILVATLGFWWWRKHKNVGDQEIRIEFLTNDWNIIPSKLKIDTMLQLVTSEQLRQSWFIDSEAIYENDNFERAMMCTPESAIAIYPGHDDDFRLAKAEKYKAIRTEIAERACRRQENDNRREEKSDRITETWQVVFIAGCALIVFLILVWLVTSGNTISCASPM